MFLVGRDPMEHVYSANAVALAYSVSVKAHPEIVNSILELTIRKKNVEWLFSSACRIARVPIDWTLRWMRCN